MQTQWGRNMLQSSYIGKEVYMLNWTVTFFVIAIIAAVLGFTSIAGSAIGIAKILFFIFLVLAVISFLFGKKMFV
jgi:uncharacterized membrane protein YtjA (UPF0391 family)